MTIFLLSFLFVLSLFCQSVVVYDTVTGHHPVIPGTIISLILIPGNIALLSAEWN